MTADPALARAHAARLDRMIADMEADGGKPWLMRAIRESIQRDLDAAQPPPPDRDAIADLLLNHGLVGDPLCRALHRLFPRSRRAEVYWATACAVTVLTADNVLALDRGAT